MTPEVPSLLHQETSKREHVLVQLAVDHERAVVSQLGRRRGRRKLERFVGMPQHELAGSDRAWAPVRRPFTRGRALDVGLACPIIEPKVLFVERRSTVAQ